MDLYYGGGKELSKTRGRGLRRRGRGTYEGDKSPVQTFTERRGKTRFFVKRKLSRDDTKKTLKTVAEGEIRVNTDEYSIYEGIDELEIVKEHRFVNHSKEYAKDGVHVNTAENRHAWEHG